MQIRFLKAERKLEQSALDALKDAWKNLYASDKENVVVLNNGIDFKECFDTSAEMQLDENKRTNAGEFAKILSLSASPESSSACRICFMTRRRSKSIRRT